MITHQPILNKHQTPLNNDLAVDKTVQELLINSNPSIYLVRYQWESLPWILAC